MTIHKLPENLRRFVSAGPVLSDATQCILELVYNSLDAQATSVAIRVNLNKMYLQVVDNGFGIAKEDLELIGEEFITSKCHSEEQLESVIDTFGYRGCALAALSRTCSSLEIQTRFHTGTATYKKIIVNGRMGAVEISRNARPACGTTVTASDIFRSLPVRRQRIKDVFDLEDILHQLESLAVIFPDISFSLRNDITGKVLLQTHRHEDSKPTLGQIFGLDEKILLIPLRFHQENVAVTGSICRSLHRNSSLQLVYVNQRIVHKSQVHILVVRLMKKYCRFWETDRSESDNVVDLEGYVFIVKIALPYQSYNIERQGRKSTLQLQDAEFVLRCVHRAVRSALREDMEDRSVLSATSVLVPNNERGKTDFGPSQLEYAVRGKQARRVTDIYEGFPQINEDTNPPEQERPSRVDRDHGMENKRRDDAVSKTPEGEKGVRKRPGEESDEQTLQTGPSDIRAYKRKFFAEGSRDGTALAENAPIFEIADFSQLSFHDFLAWLQVYARHNRDAQRLLSEYAQSRLNVVYTNKPAPLVSLKEIRREKFAEKSREMLNKMRKLSTMYKEARQKMERETSAGRKIRKRTTKTIETHEWQPIDEEASRSALSTPHLPQVSYNEFMWWLRMKANHGSTVSHLIGEFKKFKTETGLINCRQQRVLFNADDNRRVTRENTSNCERTGRFQQDLVTSKEHVGKRKLHNDHDDVLRKVQKKGLAENEPTKRTPPRKEIEPDEMDTPLYATYRSHYRKSPARPPVAVPQRPILSTPTRQEATLQCLDEMPDSDDSRKSEDVFDNIKRPISSHHLQASPVVIQKVDKIIQVSVVTADASVQVVFSSDTEEKCVQTESDNRFMDNGTNPDEPEDEVQSLLREITTSPSPKGLLSAGEMHSAKPSSVELPCGQPPKIPPSSEEQPSTGGLPIPTAIVDEEERSGGKGDLADTAPADSFWEQRTDQAGKKFFVHSVSGNTSFNPQLMSTRFSFDMQNVVGGMPQVGEQQQPAMAALQEDDLAELRTAISESCDENLANVKWLSGKGGTNEKFGEQFVKWLENAAQRTGGDLGIPTGQVPKTESAIHQLLSSFSFTRENLKKAQVLGQLDRKFIVALLKKPETNVPVLCLFDQHALDERLTLERLLKVYTTENEFKGEDLRIPLLIPATPKTMNMVKSSPAHFTIHGLSLAANEQNLIVKSVPACFIRKQERESPGHRDPLMKRMVTDYVEEIIKYMVDTRGSTLKRPKTIYNVVASEACRAAIKFNHQLELDEMVCLLKELSQCQQPFQCAHGRPTLVPIYELPSAKHKERKLNFRKFRRS